MAKEGSTIESVFLDLNRVLPIHGNMISRYGGKEGVCDIGLLQSVAYAQSSLFTPGKGFGVVCPGHLFLRQTRGPRSPAWQFGLLSPVDRYESLRGPRFHRWP